ncbi:MAG: methionyl-tRNA formyltransferase, partial [Muribaculaceae bacterium]
HIIAGDRTPIPQDQLLGEREATPAPKIFSDDCVIDWTKSAAEVHNHVRGLSPYPAARSLLLNADGAELSCKILATRKVDGQADAAPGSILCADKRLVVACADGTAVEVLRIQPAGKKAMDTEAWLRGFRLASNAHFVEKLEK